jgi:anti-sigma regulatory factor (Ser/Thr protein kinase)
MGRQYCADLGSHRVLQVLQSQIGQACEVTSVFQAVPQPVEAVLVRLDGGRPVLRCTVPSALPPGTAVHVKFKETGIQMESQVLGAEDSAHGRLSYPMWLSVPDQRQAQRVPASIPVRFAVAGEGEWHSGLAKDISLYGVRLAGPIALSPGKPVVMRLQVSGFPVPLTLQGRAVWTSPEGEGHISGIAFEDISMQNERRLIQEFSLQEPEARGDQRYGLAPEELLESLTLVGRFVLGRGEPFATRHPYLKGYADRLVQELETVFAEGTARKLTLSDEKRTLLAYLTPDGSDRATVTIWEVSRLIRVARLGRETLLQVYRDLLFAATRGRLVLIHHDEVPEWIGRPLSRQVLPIRSPEDIGACRRLVTDALRGAGWDNRRIIEFALAVCEAVTNALKHAFGGEFQLIRTEGGWTAVVSDRGIGLDLSILPYALLLPGFSTKESMGLGFKTMLRCLDRLLVATSPSGVTLVLQRFDPGQEGGGGARYGIPAH